MISAHARGLGTCWVGSPMLWLRDLGTRRELGVPDGQEPFVAFTLGYPAAMPAGAPRERPVILWN
jgi:nitroreductase